MHAILLKINIITHEGLSVITRDDVDNTSTHTFFCACVPHQDVLALGEAHGDLRALTPDVHEGGVDV